MEKSTKKRGRPAIKPYIKGLIASRDFDEQKKPPEERTPPKVLAYEIHKELIQLGEDRAPKPSTIEKQISKYRNRPVSPLDSRWSVGCLGQYDIPPEALPKVMFIYEQRLRELNQRFTIREALWIARLHKIIDDPFVLEHFASAYALRDWLDWVLDRPIHTRDFDISLIRYINGQITAADIKEFPRRTLHPLPTWGQEEDEEIEKKLRNKGYTLGIELTEEGGTK